jgi:hypothetical protein
MSSLYWNRLGCILKPDVRIDWLHSWASASCINPIIESDIVTVFVTGKDKLGRSLIGYIKYDLTKGNVKEVSSSAVVTLGERGTFDENGTGYPNVIYFDNKFYMFYLGWIKGIHVPWYNGIFLAVSEDGLKYSKLSQAPIFDRNQYDYLGVGSMFVLSEGSEFKMWYSRFHKWGCNDLEQKHYYNISYASSTNLVNWHPSGKICINFKNDYAIARPSVIKLFNLFLMWYCYRGDTYRIGFAISKDGQDWRRFDSLAGIELSSTGWDSQMICYPYVFVYKESLYLLYNGNGYGVGGLGIAKCSVDRFYDVIKNII